MYVILIVCLLISACARTVEPAAAAAGSEDLIDLLAKTNFKIEQFQFSPDGRQIAYVSSKNGSADIWVMNADGSNPRAISDAFPEAEAEPQWSPDGKWIAYVTHHCGTGCWADIFMTKPDGSITPINLTYGRGGPEPQWTPDSKSIVFVKYYGDNGFSQIGVIQADISFGRPTIVFPTGSPENEDDPQVSPDGKWLMFTAARSEKPGGPRVNGIWVMPLAGGNAKLVVAGADGGRWSPDGKRVVFVSSNAEWRNIGIADIAAGTTKMLTNDTIDNGNAQWSHDGKAIAYVANKDWNFYLKKISADGGQGQQLTDKPGVSAGFEGQNARGTFRWAPDSQSIAYTFMDYGTTSDLWTIPANGGAPKQITNNMPPALRKDQFVAPELVSYKSKGRCRDPGVLVQTEECRIGAESTAPPVLAFVRRRDVHQRVLSLRSVLRFARFRRAGPASAREHRERPRVRASQPRRLGWTRH